MKTRTELIISLQNEVDLCFEAKKTRDNDGPPYSTFRSSELPKDNNKVTGLRDSHSRVKTA